MLGKVIGHFQVVNLREFPGQDRWLGVFPFSPSLLPSTLLFSLSSSFFFFFFFLHTQQHGPFLLLVLLSIRVRSFKISGHNTTKSINF